MGIGRETGDSVLQFPLGPRGHTEAGYCTNRLIFSHDQEDIWVDSTILQTEVFHKVINLTTFMISHIMNSKIKL